jgi:hypothetical protein
MNFFTVYKSEISKDVPLSVKPGEDHTFIVVSDTGNGENVECDNQDVSEYVEIMCLDDSGQPIKDRSFIVHFSDNSTMTGKTDCKGSARVFNTVKGSCKIEFI